MALDAMAYFIEFSAHVYYTVVCEAGKYVVRFTTEQPAEERDAMPVHHRLDQQLATELYKALLDRDNIPYRVLDSMTLDTMMTILGERKARKDELRAAGLYGDFHDLNDNPNVSEAVRDALKHGETQVWYKRERAGDLCEKNPDPSNLQATHTLVACITATDREAIFFAMQGENWSPRGEANGIIGDDNLHTSMSVGDCIVIGDAVHVCKGTGWEALAR